MALSVVRLIFLIAGVYDFIIGVAFLFAGKQIFEAAEVPLPNQWAYLYFCCFMLMVFGVLFFAIAYDPVSNRNLIPFGMLLKMTYAGMVVYYWFVLDSCATLFKPFAVIDAIMLLLFIMAYMKLGKSKAADASVTNA